MFDHNKKIIIREKYAYQSGAHYCSLYIFCSIPIFKTPSPQNRSLDFNAESVLIQKNRSVRFREILESEKMQRFWSYFLYLVQNKKSKKK